MEILDRAPVVLDVAGPPVEILVLSHLLVGEEIDRVEAGPEGASKDNDILALFEVQPETPSTGESLEPKAGREGQPKAPDILDLFGGPPAEPGPGKTH